MWYHLVFAIEAPITVVTLTASWTSMHKIQAMRKPQEILTSVLHFESIAVPFDILYGKVAPILFLQLCCPVHMMLLWVKDMLCMQLPDCATEP